MGKQEELKKLTDEVQKRINEILEDSAYYLIDVKVRGWPGTRSVEIYVDGDEPVSLEYTAKLTHEIRFVLDADEVFEDDYTLHVSSPGADRPLSHPRQYKKHVGRVLEVAFVDDETEESKSVRGELVAADQEGIRLTDSDTDQEMEISYDAVKEATVELPW